LIVAVSGGEFVTPPDPHAAASTARAARLAVRMRMCDPTVDPVVRFPRDDSKLPSHELRDGIEMTGNTSPIRRVVVDGLGRLPQFCHATVADGWIHVSGTLGTMPGSLDLVEGGAGPQTTQTLRNIETILRACGAGIHDVVKMSVFLSDMSTFAEMNRAYSEVVGEESPARITVGKAGLALGAAVEIECTAYLVESQPTDAESAPHLHRG